VTQSKGPGSADHGPTFPLTVRERDVLTASVGGLNVAAVGRRLGLTPEIVRDSIASAIEKLGARSKVEAIRLAYAEGLIDVPTP
jgi:two-component system response regulator DesR